MTDVTRNPAERQHQRNEAEATGRNTARRTTAVNLDLGAEMINPETGKPYTWDCHKKGSSARVTVVRHEHGWKITGGYTRPISDKGRQGVGEFEAEIGVCRRCDPHGLIRSPKPVCTTRHNGDTELSWAHRSGYCHELGHPEQIELLVQNLLRSY